MEQLVIYSDFSKSSPAQITSELNEIKRIVNETMFRTMDQSAKEKFLNFLWQKIPNIWENGNNQVKLAAGNAFGYVIIVLAPYHYQELMTSLQDQVLFLTYGPMLHLAAFVYLGKFYNEKDIEDISQNTPLLHLFGSDESEHLINIVKTISNLPLPFRKNLAEFLIAKSEKNPNNRHIPKAIAALTSKEPESFIDLVSENIPLHIIGAIFPEKFPIIKQSLAKALTTRLADAIMNPETTANDYESACIALAGLINSGQAPEDCIQITIEHAKTSKSLSALLKLPIRPDVVRSLYEFQPPNSEVSQSSDIVTPTKPKELQFGLIKSDRMHVLPLMDFFSRNPLFTNELVAIIGESLDPISLEYGSALKVLAAVSRKIPYSALNDLLLKAFSITSPNWTHQLWTLKLISSLDFSMMSKLMSNRAFELIEDAAVSKNDTLQKTAAEVTIAIVKAEGASDQFKLFLDRFIRKLDIFDPPAFEQRLAYIAAVFMGCSGGWTLSFMHTAMMVIEAMELFDFTPKMLEGVFYILANFSSSLRDPDSTYIFVRHALGIVTQAIADFKGSPVVLPKSNLFNSQIPHTVPLHKIDSDLTVQNHGTHQDILKTARAAFTFLSHIQWGMMPLDPNDAMALLALAKEAAYLDVSNACFLMLALLDTPFFTKKSLGSFISVAKNRATSREDLLVLVRVIEVGVERLDMEVKPLMLDKQAEYLKEFLPEMTDVNFMTVLAAKNFLEEFDENVPPGICEAICKKNERHLLRSSKFATSKANAPLVNENPEALDRIKLSSIDVDPSSDEYFGFLTDDADSPIADSMLVPQSPLVSVESEVLQHVINTLTPFIAMKLDIPENLNNLPLILSTVSYTRARISEKMAVEFMEKALQEKNARAVYILGRYLIVNKYYYPVEKLLKCSVFSFHRMFSMVLPMLQLKYKSIEELPDFARTYIESATSSNLFDYALNANQFTRKNAICLVKFDPGFFASKFEQLQTITIKQAMNIANYLPSFTGKQALSVVKNLITKTRASRKKHYMALRALGVLAVSKGEKNPSVLSETSSILMEEVEMALKEKKPTVLMIELANIIFGVSKLVQTAQLAEKLSPIVGRKSVYGIMMYLLNQTTFNITEELKLIQPSGIITPIRYLKNKISDKTFDIENDEPVIDLFKRKTGNEMVINEMNALLSGFVSRKMPRSLIRSCFEQYLECTSFSPKSASLSSSIPLFKAALGSVSSKTATKMLSFVDPMFDFGVIPGGATETYLMLLVRLEFENQAWPKLSKYLKEKASYTSHFIAERLALFAMKYGKPPGEGSIVPNCRVFFDTFFAAAGVLRHRGADIGNLSDVVSPNNAISFEMLKENTKRPFACYYSTLEHGDSVPEELDALVEERSKEVELRKLTQK